MNNPMLEITPEFSDALKELVTHVALRIRAVQFLNENDSDQIPLDVLDKLNKDTESLMASMNIVSTAMVEVMEPMYLKSVITSPDYLQAMGRMTRKTN